MHHHDALWKGLLQAFFPEFLDLMIPDIAQRLRVDRGRFLEQESFVDPPAGRQALMDLLAEVPAISGQARLILIHIEVERSFRRAMDRRMWRYFCHLSLKYPRRVIIPIVLFISGGPPGVHRRRYDYDVWGSVVNRFSYWALGLSASKATELLEKAPLGVALAACARGDRLPAHVQKLLCMEAILDSSVDGAQKRLLVTAVETYLALNKEQEMKYAERVAANPRKTEVRQMELTWAGKLHQEGVEVGRREGVEQGVKQGVELSQRLLLKMLDQRFGTPPSRLKERLRQLDQPERIDAASDRILSASSPEEIEALLDELLEKG